MSRLIVLMVAVAGLLRAADLYPVSGTVMNAATNTPLPRARVYFYPSTSSVKPVASAITADNGRFAFQLPAGSYRMEAGTRDTWETYGSHSPASLMGSAVIAGPGKDTANLVFRYFPPGAISGRVTNSYGDPVEGAIVQLVRVTVAGGRKNPATFAFERTDDQGEYRFGRLPGDTSYYLAVTATPWFAQPNLLNGAALSEMKAYTPMYYPNTPDAARGAAVVLKQGQEVRADFTLRPANEATVTVRHDSPAGLSGTLALTYDGVAGTLATQQNMQVFGQPKRQRQGDATPLLQEQALRGVPPGHYTVTITGRVGAGAFSATRQIDVSGSDVTVDLSLKPTRKVTGVVRFAGDRPREGAVGVGIRGEISKQTGSYTVGPDGAFSFPSVQSGRYRLIFGGSSGVYATDVQLQGGTLRDGTLEIPEDEDVSLTITAGTDIGMLKGVVSEGNHPLEGMSVLLVDASPSRLLRDGRYIRAFQTESDGSFNFGNEPAGKYYLFAIENSELEYQTPEVLAPWLAKAKQIEIRAGASMDEKLELVR